MAKIHGTPAAFPNREASRRFDRTLAVALVCLLVLGFGAGYATATFGSLIGIGAFGASALTLAGAVRLGSRREQEFRRERLRYVRGANGEELVGWLLQELPDQWHVFHALDIDRRGDFDHFAVGPSGLFCISTKWVRGHLGLGPAGTLLHNGSPTNMGRDILRRTMDFRDRLRAVTDNSDMFVNAVLAVPLAWVDLRNPYDHVYVVHQDNLLSTLEGAPRRLTAAQIDLYVRSVDLLAGQSLGVLDAARKAERTDRA